MLKTEQLKRKKVLEDYAAKIGRWMLKAPEGRLWISSRKVNGKRHWRYLLKDGKELSLGKHQMLIRRLAKKDYLQRSLLEIQGELRNVEALLENQGRIAELYSNLHPARKLLVTPIEMTVEERIKAFLEEKTTTNPRKIENPKPTDRGEAVRSWPETYIANALYEKRIAYRYERPFTMSDGQVLYPDFSIIHPDSGELFLWEHFGRMDKTGYQSETVKKIKDYAKSGMLLGKNLIATFDDEEYKLTKDEIQQIIETFFSW